jgi:xanthine/uracil/vitamin C permease (AzgA family)
MGLYAVVAFQLVGQMRLMASGDDCYFCRRVADSLSCPHSVSEAVMDAIPISQKRAIAAGIGIFIALIGFVNSGLVVSGKGTIVAPGTSLRLKGVGLWYWFFVDRVVSCFVGSEGRLSWAY